MKNGDGIPGLVGWEWMGAPAKIPGLEVVARGRVAYAGVEREYTATLYPGPKDNIVFNAATIWWADGLTLPRDTRRRRPMGPPRRVRIRECNGSLRTYSAGCVGDEAGQTRVARISLGYRAFQDGIRETVTVRGCGGGGHSSDELRAVGATPDLRPGQGGDQGSPALVAHLGRLGLGPANHPRGTVRL